MLKSRNLTLERIDTGDYTEDEYRRFLAEIAFINRYFGDVRALYRGLLRQIAVGECDEFSLLDVGCGSGQLMLETARFAFDKKIRATLCGIDINPISAQTAKENLSRTANAFVARADAFGLPFADGSFDYVISSLFFHHLTDDAAAKALAEMKRVSKQNVVIIDLHRHTAALFFYKILCTAFRISPLVRHDGSLSIKRAFKPNELREIAAAAGIANPDVFRSLPFRLVLLG